MNKSEIKQAIKKIVSDNTGNMINLDDGRQLKLFDEPLIGFGNADDPLFLEYKKEGVIGPWYLAPKEWLVTGKTVISLFFPITEEIRRANSNSTNHASVEWTYQRVEGQEFIFSCMKKISERLKDEMECVVPGLDSRFTSIIKGEARGIPIEKREEYCKKYGIREDTYSSNWSERHAAFVCGLGTFSVTRAVITKSGIAGRFGSIIVSEEYAADKREYSDIYEYCIKCYGCMNRCPANAIELQQIKNQLLCGKELAQSKVKLYPRYGCGLCQTGVPCENKRP